MAETDLADTTNSVSQDFKREEDLFRQNECDQRRVEEAIRDVEIEVGNDNSASLDQLSTHARVDRRVATVAIRVFRYIRQFPPHRRPYPIALILLSVPLIRRRA